MTSDKIRSLKQLLANAETADGLHINKGLVTFVQFMLGAIHEDVLVLEAMAVPDAQRVTPDHIASGKVALLHTERPFA